MFVKKNDQVLVICGKDKGKTGKVMEVSPKSNKVLVEDINIVSKHKKARTQEEKSGIFKQPAFFDASNVMVVCPVCNKATKVAHKEVDGKNTRICKKCNASLDGVKEKKTTKKAETKTAKKSTSAENKTTKSAKEEK